MLASLQTLLTPGVLGVFTAYEATEIFAQPPSGPPVNLLTLIVAVEAAPTADAHSLFLNRRPIRLKSLRGWSFGVQRYQRSISDLAAALATLETSAMWTPSGSPSHTGALSAIDPVFVAPDSTEIAPLNRVLKNNFWNGGYVLEWADPAKTALKPLLEDPRRLAELAQAIVALTPIRLADLSDRLGHVIVQVPVTILMTRFGQARGGEPTVEVAWHPAVTPRPLRAAVLMDHDGALTVAASVDVQPGENTLPAGGRGLLRAWLWDQTHQLVLAATAPTAFLRSIAFNLQLSSPEPRTFSYSRADGSLEDLRVGLQGAGSQTIVGEEHADDVGGWTQRRIYREQAAQLAQSRHFKSYRARGAPQAAHAAALEDLRVLLRQHGEGGAWLWDPHLDAEGVFDTLFHCPFSHVALRALTAGKDNLASKTAFAARQQQAFAALGGNLKGLNLEFRIRSGAAGWAFHDRFLIFPSARHGALAWSLGTSVNSFGIDHHILQRVDNGQLVADAFQDLWDQLSDPAHLIWKTP